MLAHQSSILGLISFCSRQVRLFALAMAVSALSIGLAAVTLAHLLHLESCHMCIFQRLAYLAIGTTLLLTFGLWRRRGMRRLLLLVVSSMSSWGIFVSAKQSWLQWFPESGLNCTMPEPGCTERLVDCVGELFPTFFMATGDCGSKDLVIMGLSLANWSFVFFVVILLGCVFVALYADRPLYASSQRTSLCHTRARSRF